MFDDDDELRFLWQELPARVEPQTVDAVEGRGSRLETRLRNHSAQAHVGSLMTGIVWLVLAVIPTDDPIHLAPIIGVVCSAAMIVDVVRHRRRVLRIFADANQPTLLTYRRALEAQRDSLTTGRTVVRVVAVCAGFWVMTGELIANRPDDTGAAAVSALVALVITLIVSLVARGARRERLSYERQIDELPDVHPSPV
jgi:hypothetical protein